MKTQNLLFKAFFAVLGLGMIIACGSSGGGGGSSTTAATPAYVLNNGLCTNTAGQSVDTSNCNGLAYQMINGICYNRSNGQRADGACGNVVGTQGTCIIGGQQYSGTMCGTTGTTGYVNPYGTTVNPIGGGYNPYGTATQSYGNRCQYYYNPYYGSYYMYCM